MQPSFQQVPLTPQTNGLAIAALICGIVGLCTFLPSIAAIITGAIGLKKPGSRGITIAGLVLGIVGVLFWVAYLAIVLFAISTYGS